MSKTRISASVDETIKGAIDKLCLPENEDRHFSKMTEVLLKEALNARGILTPKKSKR